MRLAPSLTVRVERFGLWRSALAVLMFTVLLASAAWLAVAHRSAAAPWWSVALVVLSTLAALASALAAGRNQTFVLSWNAGQWSLDDAASRVSAPPAVGDIFVALDFGGWLLLAFTPMTLSRQSIGLSERVKARRVWLPVQRRGLEHRWHALRCAVYSPRPSFNPNGTTASPDLQA